MWGIIWRLSPNQRLVRAYGRRGGPESGIRRGAFNSMESMCAWRSPAGRVHIASPIGCGPPSPACGWALLVAAGISESEPGGGRQAQECHGQGEQNKNTYGD